MLFTGGLDITITNICYRVFRTDEISNKSTHNYDSYHDFQ